MKTIQTRALHGLTVREAAKDSGFIGILEGHAAVFDSDSLPFDGWGKPWVERIQRGAFSRTLKEQPDVKALWSHRSDAILARSPDTLSLAEDERGLRVEISLIDTQQNRDVLASVRAKLVTPCRSGSRPARLSGRRVRSATCARCSTSTCSRSRRSSGRRIPTPPFPRALRRRSAAKTARPN